MCCYEHHQLDNLHHCVKKIAHTGMAQKNGVENVIETLHTGLQVAKGVQQTLGMPISCMRHGTKKRKRGIVPGKDVPYPDHPRPTQ